MKKLILLNNSKFRFLGFILVLILAIGSPTFAQHDTIYKPTTPFVDSLIIDSYQKLKKVFFAGVQYTQDRHAFIVDISSFAYTTTLVFRIETQLSSVTGRGTIIGFFKLDDIHCIIRTGGEFRSILTVPEEPLMEFLKEAYGKQYYSIYEPIYKPMVFGTDTFLHQINDWPVSVGRWDYRTVEIDELGNVLSDVIERK